MLMVYVCIVHRLIAQGGTAVCAKVVQQTEPRNLLWSLLIKPRESNCGQRHDVCGTEYCTSCASVYCTYYNT